MTSQSHSSSTLALNPIRLCFAHCAFAKSLFRGLSLYQHVHLAGHSLRSLCIGAGSGCRANGSGSSNSFWTFKIRKGM